MAQLINNMQDMLNRAIHLACDAHYNQFDKGGKSYILHCLEVMNLLKTDCEYLKTIAVLHDTIEDSDFTLVDLKNFGFPSRVLRAVDLLSKVEGQTNQEYLYAICSNKDAMLVKLADLEHNSKISRQPNLERKDFDRLEKYFSMYRYIKTKLENA